MPADTSSSADPSETSTYRPLDFATFPSLTPPSGGERSIGATFETLASLVKDLPITGTIQFLVQSDKKRQCWLIDLGKGTCDSLAAPTPNADVELLLHADTWMELATGNLAPAEAFLQGRMRIRGNVGVGKEMLAHLSPGRLAGPC